MNRFKLRKAEGSSPKSSDGSQLEAEDGSQLEVADGSATPETGEDKEGVVKERVGKVKEEAEEK